MKTGQPNLASKIIADVVPEVDLEWQTRARCRGRDSEMFFPVAGVGTAARQRQALEARKICRYCPVVDACLATARHYGDRSGIWGGIDLDQEHATRVAGRKRERERRVRRAAAERQLDELVAKYEGIIA